MALGNDTSSAEERQVAALFSNGEQGAWYDPSDITTMFQDSAGTTPVTAVGQPVGLILDKSGRGNHAFQTTTTKRPLYQSAGGYSYLAFDGVNDAMVTNSINFTTTNKITVWAGLRKLSDAAGGIVAELSAGSPNFGRFAIIAPARTGLPEYEFASTGSSSAGARSNGFAAPITNVFTGLGDISGDSSILRINGTQAASSVSDQGTGNYGNYPIYIGSRAGTSIPFNGNIYSLIVRGAQSSGAQIAIAEQYSNSKTGAY
jgi:hypothetical protein